MSSRKVLVYLGATMPADTSYTEAVRLLGEGLARRGMTLVFGGSKEGTMAILADAALGQGGKVVGVFTKALPMEYIYHGMTETIMTENLLERKTVMYEMADAVVAMPGSFGTWDELFDALERAKVDVMHGRPAKPIAVLNLGGYYDGVMALLERSCQEGYTTRRFSMLLNACEDVEELLEWLDSGEKR